LRLSALRRYVEVISSETVEDRTNCAQVFYSIGFSGIIYTVAVLAADVTSLRNRGLAFAFTSSPYMITAFAGSKAAEAFLLNVKNWRWGFGCFAIIVPVVTAPLFMLLKLQLRKAERQGLIAEQVSKAWTVERVWKNVVAFDCKELLLHFFELS
jgi:MFS family permease